MITIILHSSLPVYEWNQSPIPSVFSRTLAPLVLAVLPCNLIRKRDVGVLASMSKSVDPEMIPACAIEGMMIVTALNTDEWQSGGSITPLICRLQSKL